MVPDEREEKMRIKEKSGMTCLFRTRDSGQSGEFRIIKNLPKQVSVQNLKHRARRDVFEGAAVIFEHAFKDSAQFHSEPRCNLIVIELFCAGEPCMRVIL